MTEFKKHWLPRILAGGCAGIALHVLLGYLLGCFSLFGPSHFTGFRFPTCAFPYRIEWLGILLSFALWALFGAEVAVATIPFADSGRELVMRSVVHYLVTAATVSAWVVLNFPHDPLLSLLLEFLIPLTLVYLLVWLGRWIGWYMEAAAIRERLGLAPGPSLFKWRESLPYFGYAGLLCLALPLVLRLLDDEVPVLSVMYAFLLLPVGGAASGLSLGKRQGVCPLYPVVCAGFILLFIPLARLFTNMDDWSLLPIAFVAALAGNLAGAALTAKQRRGKSGEKRGQL